MEEKIGISSDPPGDQRKLTVQEAIGAAKQWLESTLDQEHVKDIGLEEVSRLGTDWLITLGFSRPWDASRDAISVMGGGITYKRTYKVLTVDGKNGDIRSMKNKD